MALKILTDPLEALRIFYEGETLGADEGDFIKNEKTRGIKLPALLKDFLANYGYLKVNQGINQLWLPDQIDPDIAKVDGSLRNILIIGKTRQDLVAILAGDHNQKDPYLLVDDLPEEEGDEVTLVFHKTNTTLRKFLLKMLIEFPAVYDGAKVYNNPELIKNFVLVLDEKAKQKVNIMLESSKGWDEGKTDNILCWHEERKTFIALLLEKEENIIIEFSPRICVQEMENIFNKVFYESGEDCDYQHALDILHMLISYWLKVPNSASILATKYALAGRCSWALKRWKDAEYSYNQAEQYHRDILNAALERTAEFYEGMGNFYADREDVHKSQKAHQQADKLYEFSGKNTARHKGERLMNQGQQMMEAMRYEKAIEFYEQAIAEFQKDPKDCKYDLARCQQLRGDAKKKLKERAK